MYVIRPLFALCLALVISFTGQSMAVARGANDATGKMVLCTGSGEKLVYMDAQGNPTSAPHLCPDCLAASLDNLQPQYDLPAAVVLHPIAYIVSASMAHVGTVPFVYMSRGPPAAV
ncbi:hypothetical protein [Ascidiaceihabitans sp.]|uniref:hypothetical protein n=1 Tax=Ascidiaceihabitans sp. TaxID=1872644 RepID=UPI003296CC98